LDYLDVAGSQGDKRTKWMRDAAYFLNEKWNGKAYNVIDICNN